MRKVTFKSSTTENIRARVAYPYPVIEGKIKRKVFAQITRPQYSGLEKPWSVSVRVVKDNGWDWITFKLRFASAEEAKLWLQDWVDNIFQRFSIYIED